MAKLPRAVKEIIEAFERLPGIGPKTAQRLAFYLLHVPEYEIQKFADALLGLKKGIVKCSVCYNVAESNPCDICSDKSRDRAKLLVVEQPIDVLHFERTGKYNGLYHVLHGRIEPLNNIGPDDIYIPQLLARVKKLIEEVVLDEIILAVSSDMEGEATAMYLVKKLKAKNGRLKVTRLGYGLPVGASLEFTDETTLGRALEGRTRL